MRTRLSSTVFAGLATLALFPALAAESSAGVPVGSSSAHSNAAASARLCQTVAVKHHHRHRVRTSHRFHGRTAALHSLGKIVYVYIHPRSARTLRRRLCRAKSPRLSLTLRAFPVAPAIPAPAISEPPGPTFSAPPIAPAVPAPQSQAFAASPSRPVRTVAPANAGRPTITGSAQVGQSLVAGVGSWSGSPTGYSYQWQRCDSLGAGCVAISLATSSSYTVVESDVSHTLRVAVSASNSAGSSAPVASAQSALVTAGVSPPVNTALPTITGSAQVGQSLVAGVGSWSGSPTGYSYQWQRCDSLGAGCVAISLATSSSYTVVESDVSHTLRVAVSASNSAGSSAPVASAQSALVTAGVSPPVNTALPTITGSAQVGQSLVAGVGSWSGSPTGYSYQWQRCDSLGAGCVAISLATSSSYTVVESDVSHTLRVAVSASNSAGSSAPVASAQSALVTAGVSPPVNTALPTITGSAQVGQSLVAGVGSWSGSPTGYSYQWQRCDSLGAGCVAISLATSSSYTVVESDVSHTLRVAVSASNSAGSSAPVASAQSALVTAGVSPPVNTALPTITGSAQVGQSLVAGVGSWSGSPTGYSYQWQRCDSLGAGCVAISLATSSSYTVVESDVSHTLRVAVSASNSAGSSAPVASAQSALVTAGVSPPVNTALPTITGSAQVGQSLVAGVGSWSGSPTGYSYQWQRCDSLGAGCVAIPGASSSSYLLVPLDVGATVRVRVTASNSAGHSSATSAISEVVSGVGAQAHVMVIVEENRDRSEVIGASNMPYLNSLAAQYGNTTDWNDVGHPSLPDYLALISGSTQGVTDDGCGYSFSGIPTIGSQLSAAGIGWKAYMEGLPKTASTVCESGEYVKKHNPFAYFPETNGPNVVPASQFGTDLSSGRLPPFIFYVPNLTNDGHDANNEHVDNYLKNLVPQILSSGWYKEGGTIIITWDESNGEGKVATVVVTGQGSGKVLTTAGSHYGTLATIEDLYGVPRLGNAVGAATLAPLLK